MTEAEWVVATDPEPVLSFLKGRASKRKLRLFACACCRRIWHLISEESTRQLVEASEHYADRLIRQKDLIQRRNAVPAPASNPGWDAAMAAGRRECSAHWVALLCRSTVERWSKPATLRSGHTAQEIEELLAREKAAQTLLLRDVFGPLPFRPLSFGPIPQATRDNPVGRLARGIYEGGTFDRLPLLADALEDAGCTDDAILEHLRAPGPHVRGCFAVDLILSKDR